MAKIPKTKKTKNKTKREWDEGLSALNRNAAGIDVGSAEHYVAVPGGRDPQPVQTFGSFTSDLHRMAQWLKVCGIETVVMQATGVYWIALFQILESYGFQVNVVNARHTKTLPGRKTDVLECQWLQKLHTFGLLNNSFRPTEEIQILRTYLRQREKLCQGPGRNHRPPATARRLGMGLILDSSAVIAGERKGQTIAELLADLRAALGAEAIALATVSVIELEHGIWRALDAAQAERRE
jgi:transposase